MQHGNSPFLSPWPQSQGGEKISLDRGCSLCYTNRVPNKQNIAGWSSSVARRAHNPKVVGSNPTPATIWRHSSAGQSIRFIPEVSCVRITLPLPEIPAKLLTWLNFLLHKIAHVSETWYRQVLCANSFTSLAELSLHRAGKPALNYLVAEDRERVKGGEAACEALDVNSVFCYQPASSSCISMYFMLMYFFPPHWVPAT